MKRNLMVAIAGVIMFLLTLNVKAQSQADGSIIKKGFIKVTILYPNAAGKKFDMEYYAGKHFPLLKSLFGDALKATAIDKGIASGTPGAPLPFVAIGYLYFEKLTDFQNGMKVNATQIRADIQNYTDIQPVIQISEVVQ